MNRRFLFWICGICAVCALGFLVIGLGSNQARSLNKTIQAYDFIQLNPPSTLIPPGTLITIKKQDPLVVGIICPAKDSLGPQLHTRLLTSDSASSKQVAEMTGEFKLDAPIQQSLTTGLNAKYVRNINVTLSSVKIIELPDNVVFDLIAGRQDGCSKAVEFRHRGGEKISMVKSVIQATATYQVQFDGSLNADGRAEITRGIAGTLGLVNGVKSDDTIQGEGLIWGVRDDVSLATITTKGPPPTGAASHEMMLPTNKLAKVVPNDN